MLARSSRLAAEEYGVRMLSTTFAEFKTRSQAQICAKHLNRFMRRVSQANFVDPALLQLAMSSWFTRAVTVPGEVVPPPVIST